MALRQLLRLLLTFLFWTTLFSVAYTQSPLYTSNQNTYFLHGFACAERGNLNRDWLANTRDVTPLFSALVCLTLRWLRFEGFFYLFYALLLGIYFTALFNLAKREVDLQPRARKLAFLALFLLVHSAGWRFLLSQTLGEEWTYAFEGGLANQRLLGIVFQPSVFGVFLLVAIWLAIQRKVSLAIVALAVAVWFHPTYLLPAILLFWGLLAQLLAEQYASQGQWLPRQAILTFGMWLFLFLFLITPSVLHALSFNFTQELSPDLAERGRRILFEIRIPHHANPAVWFNLSSIFQIGLMVSGLILTRQKTLRLFLGISFMLSIVLTLLVQITSSTHLALLFPWRITTVLVPLSLTILLSRLVELLPSEQYQTDRDLLVWVVPSLSTALIAITVLVGWVRITLDFQRQINQPERPLMEFVAQHKRPQDHYLVPVKMQDFRLSTGAPIYVDFKSTPYHPVEVLEWYRRYQIADDFYQAPTCEKAASLLTEGISHIILPVSTPLPCPNFEKLYSDKFFRLIKLHPIQ